ncbi:endosomal transmembrane epsin interactor 1 isoform X2 [Cebidichthys violaceus]|uniref:endosomal transmembrane epsin interactor 1 isoform X2 n=1 Tax=Cebidichthys violaceus TaxID=271503 RepID=UPI0035CB7ADF
MSLPVVLPGSCCPVVGAPQLAEQPYRNRPRGLSASSRITGGGGGGSRLLLPGRPLLSLGLLQLLLGGSMVVLCFGALSLSNSPPIRNSCPFWAGSSVILSGIVGLTTWRRPMLLLSEAGDVCYCCSLSPSSKCPEEKLLELHPAPSCGTMRVLLKKVLFALCALNALTTAVCLMAAALRYLQIFTARAQCPDEHRAAVEEREEPAQVPDPDEFVAPAPPPSYFSTFYSYTPRLARRILGDSVIPLPHIYGTRIKGVEVFCPLDPPPPYEVVAGSSADAAAQETEIALTEVTTNPTPPAASSAPDGSPQMVSASPGTKPQILPPPPPSPPPPPLPPLPPPPPPQQQEPSPALTHWRKARIQRSNSDPVLMDLAAKVLSSSDAPQAPSPQTTDSSTQTSQPTLAACAQGQVTLRRGTNNNGGGGRAPRRPRPSSMVDYQSYRHTQQLVRKILEQPAAQGLAPEVQELVDSIRNVLQSDQEHMEEAVRCASYIEQVFTDSQMGPGQPKPPQQPAGSHSQTFPRPPRRRRRRPGLLHLQSCGDLSSFTCESVEQRGRAGSRAASRGGSGAGSRTGSRLDHPERPHSLIGVFRETVL